MFGSNWWISEGPLQDRYPRLFVTFSNLAISIAQAHLGDDYRLRFQRPFVRRNLSMVVFGTKSKTSFLFMGPQTITFRLCLVPLSQNIPG
jgi:hypothetical protein